MSAQQGLVDLHLSRISHLTFCSSCQIEFYRSFPRFSSHPLACQPIFQRQNAIFRTVVLLDRGFDAQTSRLSLRQRHFTRID